MKQDLDALEDALWNLCADPPERLLLALQEARPKRLSQRQLMRQGRSIPPLKRRAQEPKYRRIKAGSRPALLLMRLAVAPLKRSALASTLGCDNIAANEMLSLMRHLKGEPKRGDKNLEPLITYDGATLQITSAGCYMVAQLLAADLMTDLGYSTVNALETLALIVSETIRSRVWAGDIDAVVEARKELLSEPT